MSQTPSSPEGTVEGAKAEDALEIANKSATGVGVGGGCKSTVKETTEAGRSSGRPETTGTGVG